MLGLGQEFCDTLWLHLWLALTYGILEQTVAVPHTQPPAKSLRYFSCHVAATLAILHADRSTRALLADSHSQGEIEECAVLPQHLMNRQSTASPKRYLNS